ncbi:MAG: HlyD family efflux transporter periplasmic adaptor subunit [Candidatus Omnitrophica bacterium]|nr:HlyD family efflux transporter periplasmic adaptor subunit [Candidatus Omnitrophota bacterium]
MKILLKKILKNKIFYLLVILIAAIAVLGRISAQKRRYGSFILFEVKKQNLLISVVEGGNLVALQSQKIVNEVPGSRTILEVVDEGIQITEEDVRNGKVLVKLDSKDLEDRREQLKLSVENSQAALTDGEQRLEILKKQNVSDITQAELKVKFAEMDLKKYLGDSLAESIADRSEEINFAVLIRSDNLGGEALNKKRALETKIDLAKEEVARAKDKVEWSQRLSEKGYVTKMELEADKLSLKQKEVSQEQAELEYQLFLKYDFTKQVEKLLSDYEEAQSELQRVIATAESKMIQEQANLRNKRSTHILNTNNLRDVEKNIENCIIRASSQGFVTYATSGRPWASQSPIQPGTSIRQYQELFNLPDFRSMGVEIKVHESSIKRITRGLSANVRIDAFPDVSLTGRVGKISLMPDSTIKFLNPDINVYVTTIILDSSTDFLKPGMTAQVEIIVKEIKDVIAVPVNAVSFMSGQPYCSVLKGGTMTDRRVELGDSSDTMVEVKSGLHEGEKVVMKPGTSVTPAVKKTELEERGVFKEGPASGEGTSLPVQQNSAPAGVSQGTQVKPSVVSAENTPSVPSAEGIPAERRRGTGERTEGSQRSRPSSEGD